MVTNFSSVKQQQVGNSEKVLSLLEQGDYHAALVYLQGSVQAPQDSNSLVNQAVCFIHLNLPQEALDACDRALALEPTYAQAWLFKGVAFHRLGRHQDAYACYNKALEKDSAEEFSLNEARQPVEAFKAFIKRLSKGSLLKRLWVH